MTGRSKEDPRTVRNRLIWEDSSAWIGRIFAVMLFMAGPVALGLWLDQQLQTTFLSIIGVMVGMGLGVTMLLILVSVKRPTLDDQVQRQIDGNSEGDSPDADQPR